MKLNQQTISSIGRMLEKRWKTPEEAAGELFRLRCSMEHQDVEDYGLINDLERIILWDASAPMDKE